MPKIFRLVRPAPEHKERAFQLLEPYLKVDGGIEASAGLDCYLAEGDYEGWLDNLKNQLHNPDPDYVPHETFFFMDGEKILGIVNILHRLPTRYKWVGHIGYSIHPEARRQGKGTILLKLALNYCFELGIKSPLVCISEDNLPSCKLAEKCGGVYKDTVDIEGEGFKRYYFKLRL